VFKTSSIRVWILCVVVAQIASLRLTAQEKSTAEPHWEEGRVKITLPTPEMTVAQPNAIPLDLHGFDVSRVAAGWKFSEPGLEGMSIAEPADVGLQHSPDGTPFIQFVPVRVGLLQLNIQVDFKDGGADADTIEINVDHLPEIAPHRLILSDTTARVDYRRKAGTMHFDLSPDSRVRTIAVVAFYPGVSQPVPLNPMPAPIRNDVVFTVITKNNRPSPIELEPVTGAVTAVRVGQAIIKATLGGKSAYACADVSKDAREFAERSNCNDFLPRGMSESIDEPLQMPQPVQPRAR
jgi:hypothetical protein